MKKISITLYAGAAFVLLCVFSSCKTGCVKGSGVQKTETRKLGDFTRIDIEGGFKLNIKQDSSMGISISADDNLLKLIHTTISGGRLHIYSKKNFCAQSTMVVNVGIRSLELIKAAGAIDIQSEGRLNLNDIKFDLAGANKVNLDISAANVSTEASGANEVHLSGQAATHKVNMTGSGKLYAFTFIVGDYDLETAGASHSEINVLKNLKINTVGASEVQYKGNPGNIQNDKSGASKVTKVD